MSEGGVGSSKKVRNNMPMQDLGRIKKGQKRRNKKGEEEKGKQRLNTRNLKIEVE